VVVFDGEFSLDSGTAGFRSSKIRNNFDIDAIFSGLVGSADISSIVWTVFEVAKYVSCY